MASKQQQVAQVVEGLGLGLLALDVSRVPAGKLKLELAFSYARRRWPHADDYPAIGRAPKPDNEFWIGVTKSERRTTPTITWQNVGGSYELVLTHVGWTLAEVADLLCPRPLDQWVDLASHFHGHLDRYA